MRSSRRWVIGSCWSAWTATAKAPASALAVRPSATRVPKPRCVPNSPSRGVIAGISTDAITITEKERDILLDAADLVTRARTGVEYDYKDNVIDAHAPEMPTRFAKQLQQVMRGAVAIGIPRRDALKLAIRCARDSMPPLALTVIHDLSTKPGSSPSDVRRRVNKPWTTVDRQLQALHMLEVLDCDEEPLGDSGKTRWLYSLAEDINPDALRPEKLPETSPESADPTRRETANSTSSADTSLFPFMGIAKSGQGSGPDLHTVPRAARTRADSCQHPPPTPSVPTTRSSVGTTARSHHEPTHRHHRHLRPPRLHNINQRPAAQLPPRIMGSSSSNRSSTIW